MMARGDEEQWVSDVLVFWFEELKPEQWYVKDAALDHEIKSRFFDLYRKVAAHDPAGSLATPRAALATVIVLDQFPRNMFRDRPEAFATDYLALEVAGRAVCAGLDKDLSDRQRQFLYMPFEHSESAGVQARSVELFSRLELPEALGWARRHKAVIDRFGRFPHRNAILGRPSTDEERAFLRQPGSNF